MPGLDLELIIAKIRQSDLDNFEKKIKPQEEAKEQQLIAEGLKNVSMLVSEYKRPDTDLDFMGEEVKTVKLEQDGDQSQTGEEMMSKFLEQLK